MLNEKWIAAMREGDSSSSEAWKLATEIGRHIFFLKMPRDVYSDVVENPSDTLREKIVSSAAKALPKDENGNYSYQPIMDGFNSAVQRYIDQCLEDGEVSDMHDRVFGGVPTQNGENYAVALRGVIQAELQKKLTL